MQVLQACAADARGRTGHEQDDYPQAEYLLRALEAAQSVNARDIAQQCQDAHAIAERLRIARVEAVSRSLRN